MALGLVVLHATAWAQAPDPKPPAYRASLGAGVALRGSDTTLAGQPQVHIGGFAPFTAHFSGDYFFLSWLGVQLDGSFETFSAQRKDPVTGAVRSKTTLFGGQGVVEAVFRWSPWYFLGLELHLGFGVGGWPSLEVIGGVPLPKTYPYLGPASGFAISVEPNAPFGGQLYFRIVPGISVTSGFAPFAWTTGLQLHFGRFRVGESSRLQVLLETELWQAAANDGVDNEFTAFQVRFNLGFRVREQPPPATVDTLPPKTGNGTLRGRVVVGGVGIAGVSVTAGTLPLQKTGADGDFEYRDVKPGPIIVRALAEGYKPLEQMVDVPPGDEANVTLTLVKPTGPGRIKGVLKGDKDLPVEGADVALEGKAAVKSGADGSYVLDQAGPGPAKVTVKAKGYKDAEDAAQVPPEGEATLDFKLVKQGEKQLATIRGLVVRSTTGKPVKATVKISDVNMTVPVKGDGRFVVQVPGGKYTLTIEAAGYVTQVKTVEVADGDQAIFHCDLQPAGR